MAVTLAKNSVMQDAQMGLGGVAKRFALLCVPLLSVTAAVLFILYQTQAAVIEGLTTAGELQIAMSAVREVGQQFSSLVDDVRSLAAQAALHDVAGKDSEAQRQRLTENYLAFVRAKAYYERVRVVDAVGGERLRIERRGSEFHITAPSAGPVEIDVLPPGEVSILAPESEGGTGLPASAPTLHWDFTTPVYGPEGDRRGAVMLDYSQDKLITSLQSVETAETGVWWVNGKGDWLAGAQSSAQRARSFAMTYSEAWAAMQSGARQGRVRSDQTVLTYVAVAPASLSKGDGGMMRTKAPVWFFIAHTPAAVADAPLLRLRRSIVLAWLVLAAILVVGTWVLSHVTLRRERAERARAAAEERYRQLVNNLNVGVYRVYSRAHGSFIESNDALLRMLNVSSREELMRQPVKRFYADPDVFARLSQELLDTGAVVDRIVEGVRTDGTHFWASLTAVRRNDAEGNLYFDGIISDVTARRAAELALTESEVKFRRLLESVPDAILIVDAAGRITLANAQAERLFGYPREELLGHSVDRLLSPEAREMHKLYCGNNLSAPELRPMTDSLDIYAIRKDGSHVPIDVNLNPIELSDGVAAVASIRDITQRKQAESEIRELNHRLANHVTELTALNHELEAFSYSVSHDLRAPLRSIDGFSQALLEDYHGQLDAQGRDYLVRVRDASRRMSSLIDDLLLLSRITRAEMTKTTLDMSAMANEILDELRRADPRRTVECAVEADLVVDADPRLLRVALTNLLDNAWKFTAKRPAAKITVGKQERDGDIAYYVTDNGAGFDLTYVDKLFGVFQRLHSVDDFPGTGVGLAIVQRVIQRHGGKVWADAAVDRGATFYFTLSPVRE